MAISSIVKRLISIAFILIAAFLAYGFIDGRGYRNGYDAGYGSIGRLVDAACINGLVLDKGICEKAESALYKDDVATVTNGMGLAQVSAIAESVLPATTAPVKRAARKKKFKPAPVQEDSANVGNQPVNQPVVNEVQATPVVPALPQLSKEAEGVYNRILKAQQLPDTFCSQYKDKGACFDQGDFKCSWDITSGKCIFTALVTGLRAI